MNSKTDDVTGLSHMSALNIVDLKASDTGHIELVSKYLYLSFIKYSPDWLPDHEACLAQIQDSFEADRCSRIMLDASGLPIGWIGAIKNTHTWEIHPIAVSPHHRRQGVGRRLVADIENIARGAGASAVWAGTGDETNVTSFSQIDLYANPEEAFSSIDAPDDHAVTFWRGIGYTMLGFLPDEEGLGKPGIHFGKRIVSS